MIVNYVMLLQKSIQIIQFMDIEELEQCSAELATMLIIKGF